MMADGGGGGTEGTVADMAECSCAAHLLYDWSPATLPCDRLDDYMAQLPRDRTPWRAAPHWRRRARLRQQPPHDDAADSTERRLFLEQRRRARATLVAIGEAHGGATCAQCARPCGAGSSAVCWMTTTTAAAAAAPGRNENRFLHPGCVRCHTCHEPLVDLVGFQLEGRLLCARHFADALRPRCAHCDQLVWEREFLEAEGRAWHVEHVRCARCQRSLATTPYVRVGRQDRPPPGHENDAPPELVCLHCHQTDPTFVGEEEEDDYDDDAKNLVAPRGLDTMMMAMTMPQEEEERCAACDDRLCASEPTISFVLPISPLSVESQEEFQGARRWHARGACFSCTHCNLSLLENNFQEAADAKPHLFHARLTCLRCTASLDRCVVASSPASSTVPAPAPPLHHRHHAQPTTTSSPYSWSSSESAGSFGNPNTSKRLNSHLRPVSATATPAICRHQTGGSSDSGVCSSTQSSGRVTRTSPRPDPPASPPHIYEALSPQSPLPPQSTRRRASAPSEQSLSSSESEDEEGQLAAVRRALAVAHFSASSFSSYSRCPKSGQVRLARRRKTNDRCHIS